jgi:hypothetical protein
MRAAQKIDGGSGVLGTNHIPKRSRSAMLSTIVTIHPHFSCEVQYEAIQRWQQRLSTTWMLLLLLDMHTPVII